MKKSFVVLIVFLLISTSLFACTIFGVGRKATVDGSTITSHTSDDSDVNPFDLLIYPSVKAGSIKKLYVNDGNPDFYNILESDPILQTDKYLGTYEYPKDSNQFLFAQSGIANNKGLTICESTCDYSEKQVEVFKDYQGKWDLLILQQYALENANSAKEAVLLMGDMLNKEGWRGYPECMILGDGTDVWVFETYGWKMWAAFRLPEDSVFVCSNRSRIDFYIENDPENYLCAPNMKEFAIQTGLWDGVGDFRPNQVFAIGGVDRFGCIGREWRAICNLTSQFPQLIDNEEYALTKNPDDDFPLCFVPDKKISIQTIKDLYSDYYQGTGYDLTKTLNAGRYGNPLQSKNEYSSRPTNLIHTAYFQIGSVKSWLPVESRCVVYYGVCAPLVSYITPIFPSQKSLSLQLSKGSSREYDENSSWWQMVVLQEACVSNFKEAYKIVSESRDPLLESQYLNTEVVQNLASRLIESGQKDIALTLLTNYSLNQHKMWFDLYSKLPIMLLSKAGYGRIKGENTEPAYPELWEEYDKLIKN